MGSPNKRAFTNTNAAANAATRQSAGAGVVGGTAQVVRMVRTLLAGSKHTDYLSVRNVLQSACYLNRALTAEEKEQVSALLQQPQPLRQAQQPQSQPEHEKYCASLSLSTSASVSASSFGPEHKHSAVAGKLGFLQQLGLSKGSSSSSRSSSRSSNLKQQNDMDFFDQQLRDSISSILDRFSQTSEMSEARMSDMSLRCSDLSILDPFGCSRDSLASLCDQIRHDTSDTSNDNTNTNTNTSTSTSTEVSTGVSTSTGSDSGIDGGNGETFNSILQQIDALHDHNTGSNNIHALLPTASAAGPAALAE